jgi:AcrR family transcriptional regulator
MLTPVAAELDPQTAPDQVVDERETVLRSAIALYRERAFHEVTPSLVAERADLHLRTVIELFPTQDVLMTATVDRWYGQRMAPLVALAERFGAAAFLRGIVIANTQDPGLMRLLMATVNLAATPGHPLAPELQRKWVQFHAVVQRALAHDITVGREPSTMEPARGAEQLIAVYEGLQVQWMLRPHMDVLESYDRAVTRLRDGWSRAYTPPVWEI